MFKEHVEILNSFEKGLAEKTEKMKSSIRMLLNDSLKNENIYSLFFVCEDYYRDMNIKFYGIDNNKRVFLKRDTFTEINEPLFSKKLHEKAKEIENKYEYDEKGNENMDFEDSESEYRDLKPKKLLNWFINCWESIKMEFKDLPQTYFVFGNYAESDMGSYTIDLSTKRELENNERMKLLKSLR